MSYSTQLLMTLPELVLAAGSIVLMLVAAFGGQASTKLVSWASVALLAGAGIALAGPSCVRTSTDASLGACAESFL